MSDKQLYVFGDHTIERDGESTTFNRPRTKSKLEGTERAQCRKCGEVFSRTSNFDRHRKGGNCVDPATVGLEIKAKGGNSWWQQPGNGFHHFPKGDDHEGYQTESDRLADQLMGIKKTT